MITRRSFLHCCAATGMALPLLDAAAPDSPNLLIIHTDEHNFRTLGCYREQLPKEEALVWGEEAVCATPHIDSIAKEGLICNRFYASTPVCSPSRGSFVSGLYPQNSYVTTNDIPLGDHVVSFAEILRRRGYATGYCGKWHLDGEGKPQWGPERNFGFADNRFMYNRGHWKKLALTAEGQPRVDTGAKPGYDCSGATAENFTTDVLTDWTIDFIRKHKSEAFCYMVSIPDPHGPNRVRAPYDNLYREMKFSAPKTMRREAAKAPSWAKPQVKRFAPGLLKSYFGMVKCIDDNVGRILTELKTLGILDKTIVVFTADHGDLCYEHGKHNKGNPLEASAKIPFVLRYPQKIAAGTVVDEALTTVDFLPTILGLMGVESAGKEDGRNAAPLLCRNADSADWEDVVFIRSTCKSRDHSPHWIAAINKRYKLVVSSRSKPWLIDLERHADELTNSFADPACKKELRILGEALRRYCQEHDASAYQNASIRYDVDFAAAGKGAYTPPKRSVPKAKRGGKEKTK